MSTLKEILEKQDEMEFTLGNLATDDEAYDDYRAEMFDHFLTHAAEAREQAPEEWLLPIQG